MSHMPFSATQTPEQGEEGKTGGVPSEAVAVIQGGDGGSWVGGMVWRQEPVLETFRKCCGQDSMPAELCERGRGERGAEAGFLAWTGDAISSEEEPKKGVNSAARGGLLSLAGCPSGVRREIREDPG